MEDNIKEADKRLRALKVKYGRIIDLEYKVSKGETLDEAKKSLIESKPVVEALIDQLCYIRDLLFNSHCAAAAAASASTPTTDRECPITSSTDDQIQGKGKKRKKEKKKKDEEKKRKKEKKNAEDHPHQREEEEKKKKRGKKKRNKKEKKDQVGALQTEVESHNDDLPPQKDLKRLGDSVEASGFKTEMAERVKRDRDLIEKALPSCNSILDIKKVVERYLVGLREYVFMVEGKNDIIAELKVLEKLCGKLDLELNKILIDSIRADISYFKASIEISKIPDVKDMVKCHPELVNDECLRKKIINRGETVLCEWSDASDFFKYDWLPHTYSRLNTLQQELVRRESEVKDQQQMAERQLEDQKREESYEVREITDMELNKLGHEEVEKRLKSLNEWLTKAKSKLDSFYPNSGNLHKLHRLSHLTMDGWKRKLARLEAEAVR